MLMMSLVVAAQVRFGYMSYSQVCKQMPEFAQAQKSLEELKAVYQKEATRNEDEFQRKFSEFLEGQKDFPSNILQKRQAELQDLMDKGIAFRRECQDLLDRAERDLMKEVESKLNEAIRQVGLESGYAYIANTDGNALPFVNPLVGDDVTLLVLVKLGLAEPESIPVAPATSGEENKDGEANNVHIPADGQTQTSDSADDQSTQGTRTECAEDTDAPEASQS